jgi:hypothetical protein
MFPDELNQQGVEGVCTRHRVKRVVSRRADPAGCSVLVILQ